MQFNPLSPTLSAVKFIPEKHPQICSVRAVKLKVTFIQTGLYHQCISDLKEFQKEKKKHGLFNCA